MEQMVWDTQKQPLGEGSGCVCVLETSKLWHLEASKEGWGTRLQSGKGRAWRVVLTSKGSQIVRSWGERAGRYLEVTELEPVFLNKWPWVPLVADLQGIAPLILSKTFKYTEIASDSDVIGEDSPLPPPPNSTTTQNRRLGSFHKPLSPK